VRRCGRDGDYSDLEGIQASQYGIGMVAARIAEIEKKARESAAGVCNSGHAAAV
jgi:hypothetical protein